jgi:serine/threonine protein phosphatase PrpC
MADNFFGITDTGKLRDNNEDTFIAQKVPNGWVLACVIDGVGGYEGGEIAAAIAQETILREMQKPFTDATQALRKAVWQANQNIYLEKQKEGRSANMACVLTVALVDVEANQFYYAHVGDTRMYLLRDGSLVKVTKDHSFVGFLEDSGRLSEKEAMLHPKRNEINKALGFDGNIALDSDYIETGSSPFLPRDLLLLCSDGLTDMVNNEEMTAILLSAKSLPEKGNILIEAANSAGGKDNITAVLVRNNKKPLKLEATKPAITKKTQANEPIAITDIGQSKEVPIEVPKQKSSNAVWILTLLSLLLAGGCWWLWTKNKELTKPLQTIVQKAPNAAEKLLADSVAIAPRTLMLTDSVFGKITVLGDTVFIRQDSLHIDGAGLVLQADSSYTGPAFYITANNKYLLLENMTFKDFEIAIATQSGGLQLKNVVFQNSIVPVQQSILLPLNDTLSGTLRDTFLIKKDSTRK